VTWPYSERISPGTAWAMIGTGLTCLVGVASIFEGLQGSKPGYCWWWPTAWMLVPLLLTLAGVALLAVPLRRGTAAELRYGVGEGVPGYTGPFRRAVNDLTNLTVTSTDGIRHPVSILDARGPAYVDGPGVVQETTTPRHQSTDGRSARWRGER